MDNTLVILTLNEVNGIKVLFDRIPFFCADECFVVDGGSRDGTIEFLRNKGLNVVVQRTKGRGEAFRIGVNEAKGKIIVFFSPDGNEDPNDIPRLFQLLKQGNDMVIASRFLPGAVNEEDIHFFKFRKWVNRIFTFTANLLWNHNKYVTDTINGYRGIRKSAFQTMKIDALGFVVEYQMSIRAMKLGLRIAEIPTREGQRIGGESTAKSIPTGILFLRFLINEILKGKNF